MIVNRIIFLSIMAAIGVISASLCAPALPFIANHFSTHFSYIQFTISLFLVGNAFGQFLSGPLSDQLGQRTILLGGLILYIIASCGCAIADHMGILLIARFFQGMGSSVGPVLSRAIATSSFPPSKSAQVQSYGAIGVGIASIIAILSSGHLTMVSWRSNFWLAASLGVILFPWAWVTLKESSITVTKAWSLKKVFPQMLKVIKHPDFFRSAFAHSMTYALMYGYIGLFPFLMMEFFQEKNPITVGIYSAYMIGFYMLGAFLASRMVLRWEINRVVVVGMIVQLIAGIGATLAYSPLLFIGALFLFNTSIGIILPLTAASALSPFIGHAVGTASSSLGLSYRLIGSILSMLICQFPLAGGRNLGLSILFLSLLSLGVFRRLSSLAPQKV